MQTLYHCNENKPGRYEHTISLINKLINLIRPFKYFSTPKPISNLPPETTDSPCVSLNTETRWNFFH